VQQTLPWRRLLVLQLGVGLAWLPFYRFNVLADAISYTVLARHWAHLNTDFLVNSYWSPLASWLMMPFAWISQFVWDTGWQIESGVFKLLGLVAGWVGLLALDRLALQLQMPRSIRWGLAIGWACFFTHWAMLLFLADTLSAVCVLWALVLALRPSFGVSTGAAIGVGIWLALAWYSKAYNLVFALALAGILLGLSYKGWPGLRRYRKAIAQAVAVLLLLAAPWVVAVSVHEGHFSIGSTGAYNLQLMHVRSNGQSHDRLGLLPPPDSEYSISAWDEITASASVQADLARPTYSLQGTGWALWLNTKRLALSFWNRGWWLWLLPIGLWWFRHRVAAFRHPVVALLGVAGLLYGAGYWLTVMDDRYLGPTWAALVLVGAYAAYLQWPSKQRWLAFAIALLVGAWPIYDLWRWRFDSRPDAEFAQHTFDLYLPLRHQHLAAWPGIGWHYGEEFAYRTQMHFWGTPPVTVPAQEAVAQLRAAPVQWVLVRTDTVGQFPALDTLGWVVYSDTMHTDGTFRLYRTQQPSTWQ
jgi:hypothetical protein